IVADLNSRGWNVTNHPTYGAATFGLFAKAGGGEFGLLAPTIQTLDVDEYRGRLFLNGEFGTDSTSNAQFVSCGNQDLHIIKWEKDKIECDLPIDAYGDVVVTVGIRKSNVRQLTRWDLTINFKETREGYPSLKITGPIMLRFRADIGEYRKKPAET